MASRSQVKAPAASKSVFINCPFDDEYRPIFRAIVFTVVLSGYHPRCALDATDGAEVRVHKIADMIGACDWGIHDISRIEVAAGGVPRFNMPMELGLHLGARLFGQGRQKRKRALILDSESHRYDVALSDISGQDIESHGNKPNNAIGCIRNWLSEHRTARVPLPGANALQTDYQAFQTEVAAVLLQHRLGPLENLTHSDYLFAIRDWVAVHARAA